MSNSIYPKAREKFLSGDLDWDAHNFKVALLPSGYTYASTHDFLDDVTGVVTPIATSGNLASKTATNGYADAADVNFPTVAGGSTVVAFIVYRDTGVASTSELVAYNDTSSTGVPISYATDGNDIDIVWSSSGLFRL